MDVGGAELGSRHPGAPPAPPLLAAEECGHTRRQVNHRTEGDRARRWRKGEGEGEGGGEKGRKKRRRKRTGAEGKRRQTRGKRKGGGVCVEKKEHIALL